MAAVAEKETEKKYTEEDAQAVLNKLCDARQELATAEDPFNKQIAEIQRTKDAATVAIREKIGKLENEARATVVLVGKTVRGHGLMGVYTPPKAVWDDNGLLSYAKDGHPEVLAFRSEKSASASIRDCK